MLPWYEILLRLGLAMLFGMLVGMEREHRQRPAGIKTHILVCMGAALVSIIQIKMIEEVVAAAHENSALAEMLKSDIGRMGAQVISGVGFLGAGTILRTKGTIKGLTTAATLWLIACVGLAVGMGYYKTSLMAITLTMIVLIILHIIQNSLVKGRGLKHIEVTIINKREAMNYLNDYCINNNILIKNIELYDSMSDNVLTYVYTLLIPRTITIDNILVDIQMDENILSASIVNDSLSE